MRSKKVLALLGAAAILIGGCGDGTGKTNEVWNYLGGEDTIARQSIDGEIIEILAVVPASGDVIESKDWLYYISGNGDSIKKTKYDPDKAIRITRTDIAFTSKKDNEKHRLDDNEALQKELGVSDEILLYSGRGGDLALDGDTLYFVNEDEDNSLFSVKTDGTQSTRLTKGEDVLRVAAQDDSVVYITTDGIFAMKKDGSDKKQLADYDVFPDWVGISKGWVYYLETMTDESVINRIKLDGSGKAEVISDVFDPHIVDEWIYFMRDDGLYRCKGDGSKAEKVK